MSNNKSSTIIARLGDDEARALKTLIDQSGLSQSEIIRRAITGAKISSRFDYETMRKLFATNANLASLGNLQKLCITTLADENDRSDRSVLIEELDNLKHQILTTQSEFKAYVLRIKI